MYKKILLIYMAFIMMFGTAILRIYGISQSNYFMVADNQSSYVLDVSRSRGYIYDVNLKPMVNEDSEFVAAILPSPESLTAVTEALDHYGKLDVIPKFEQGFPFVKKIENADIYSRDVEILKTKKRYQRNQLAPHLIGYLDNSTGEGISGIEKAYNELLTEHSGTMSVRYRVDALGNILKGKTPEVINQNYNNPGGVVLTIDKDMQRIAEQAARKVFSVGSVVVMDVDTGDIKASVSLPTFDPNDQEKSINAENAPFVNRSFNGEYSVGSTFKLLVAATAIEQGISQYNSYNCTGSTEIGGQVFKCNKLDGHGVIDMQTAVEKSCNTYFIDLIQKTGSESVRFKAQEIGFGRSAKLAEGYVASAGYLPTSKNLSNAAERANFAFGQGMLTASPLQIAQMIATIANSGMSVVPRIAEGITQDGKVISDHTVVYAQNRIITQKASDRVAQFMVSTVEQGSGKKAKPEVGGAGGKTGSSQTGRFIDGIEVVHAWFAGFFPAYQPKYVIVVLAEGMESGGNVSAPVFKEIADGINSLETMREKNR